CASSSSASASASSSICFWSAHSKFGPTLSELAAGAVDSAGAFDVLGRLRRLDLRGAGLSSLEVAFASAFSLELGFVFDEDRDLDVGPGVAAVGRELGSIPGGNK